MRAFVYSWLYVKARAHRPVVRYNPLTDRTHPHHSNAYNLVLHKHAELLYQGVTEAVQAHLSHVGLEVSALPDAQVRAVGRWIGVWVCLWIGGYRPGRSMSMV